LAFLVKSKKVVKMLTNYQEVYNGEIFVKSQCIELENSLMDFFRFNLSMLGYESISSSGKIWQRGNKKVVICLVDDITSCAATDAVPTAKLFDSDTTVITDNRIYSPTEYQLLTLPDSFFGIYYYQPKLIEYTPEKRFNLSINRIDPVRLSIFLELAKRSMENNIIFANDHVNFNCYYHDVSDNVFNKLYGTLYPEIQGYYYEQYNRLKDTMPYRNHELTVEESMMSAGINMIVETYSGKDSVALSEKIFRALATPAPWTIYAARNSVAVLKSLGFDVLDDIVNHRYNYHNYEIVSGAPGSRVVEYVWESIQNVLELQSNDQHKVKLRCKDAALHNQNILKQMRQQWPQDFATWWQTNLKHVA
jgi:hypothetical protein